MSSSKFAQSFAPYTPPPDDPSYIAPQAPVAPKSPTRPWFPVHGSSRYIESSSYQSGGIPTFGASASGGSAAVEQAETAGQNQWETTYGARVDILAAVAYILGPVTALILLIFETQNDYVRFHAYQSALMTTPLVIIRMLASLFGFADWIKTFFNLVIIIPSLYMAFRAYRDASENGLVHYQLPYIGQIADQWLGDE